MIWQTDCGAMYFYDGGEAHVADAPVICFIHGAAMDHTVWTLFARYWAKNGFNVAAIDLPGHGLSGGKPIAGIRESATFLGEVIDRQFPRSAVCWVGHSMGSLIALECARSAARSTSLIMMGTAFPMQVGAPLLESAKANKHLAIDIVSLFGHSFAAQLGGNPVAGIHAQRFAERLMEQANDDVMYLDLNACHTYGDGLQAAAELDCPVSLILGELDRMTPVRGAKSLIEALTGAKVFTLPDCGHMMMTEQPEQTHAALRAAIETLATRV